MEVKYTQEQIEEDILAGTCVIGNDVRNLLKTLRTGVEWARYPALVWRNQRARIAVWSVQCVLMVVCAKAWAPWWVLAISIAIGGVLSVCYEVYVYRRERMVRLVTAHVNAVYDRQFDEVWMEMMMVKIWKVINHFPKRGHSAGIKSMNKLMSEKP